MFWNRTHMNIYIVAKNSLITRLTHKKSICNDAYQTPLRRLGGLLISRFALSR